MADGVTTVNNAAMEPEIVDLSECLNKMGAKIYGAGTNVIKIVGVKNLKSVGYKIMPDRIEAGTFMCAGAITGGNVIINNIVPEHIVPVIHKLEECGCKINVGRNSLQIIGPRRLKAVEIKTMPYPRFPNRFTTNFWSNVIHGKRKFSNY